MHLNNAEVKRRSGKKIQSIPTADTSAASLLPKHRRLTKPQESGVLNSMSHLDSQVLPFAIAPPTTLTILHIVISGKGNDTADTIVAVRSNEGSICAEW